MLCLAASPVEAQTALPSPTQTKAPLTPEAQEKVRVFTEEVVIPVGAYDDSGHLSAALEPQDILVFEDDVRQTVRSVRRIPANVLLLLDTGGELNPEGLRRMRAFQPLPLVGQFEVARTSCS